MDVRSSPLLLLACAVALALVCGPASVLADTPANCTYGEFLGSWKVSISSVLPTPSKPSLNCNYTWAPEDSYTMTLAYPNVATVAGTGGNWTLIYNQGIEVWADGTISFFFADFNAAGDDLCSHSSVGYLHTKSLPATSWRCMSMVKVSDAPSSPASQHRKSERQSPQWVDREQATLESLAAAEFAASPQRLEARFSNDHSFIAKVNEAAQGMFTVKAYPELEGMPIRDLERRRGTSALKVPSPWEMHAPAAECTHTHTSPLRRAAADIPTSFDWRNVSGVNYVSPVRDQGQCGSCYAYSSAGQLEARIRVKTGNKLQPILSTQDVVSCSVYSQGCEGGFPYLIAGKYGRDYGFAEEACYPYAGLDSACTPNPSPSCNPERWMVDQYYYVGGFYGQSNPQRMQEEVMANGPISVSFMVYDDFMHYAGGVYTHKFARELQLDDYNPFVLTNHAVLLVGWGVTDDASQTPYWIVKNSWSTSWGENGYFRILRGSSELGGECAIESITVAAIPKL